MLDMGRIEKILAASDYKSDAWLYDESVYNGVRKAVENYLAQRRLKPRWRKGGGGAGKFYPLSVGLQNQLNLQPGEVYLTSNWKDPDVKVRWRVRESGDTRYKIPLVEAFDKYQKALKNKTSKERENTWVEKN